MSDKFEFGDFYKFVTSVGIAVIGLSFALPWLFLREQFDLRVSNSDLKTLPQESGVIIAKRLAIELFIFRCLPLTCLVLLFVGLSVFALGCYMWWSRQKWRDRAENASTQVVERDLKSMTPPQVEAKALLEIQASDDLDEGSIVARNRVPTILSVTSYMEMEIRIKERFEACFSRTHYVLFHQSLGAAEFDFILQDKGTGRTDSIIELKVRAGAANPSWLLASIRQAALGAQAYSAATRKPAVPILLIVIPDNRQPAQIMIHRAKRVVETDPSLRGVNVVIISEEELFTADCYDLRQHLGMQ